MGKEFLGETPYIKINTEQFDDIINSLESIGLKDQKLQDIIFKLNKMRHISVYDMLKEYPSIVQKLAEKLGKYVYPMQIKGDKDITLPPICKTFTKTLIHVFSNCVEHGIEDIDTRAKQEKDEMATIKCSYKVENNKLYLRIGDDGAGINTNKLISNAIKKGLVSKEECNNMDEGERLKLIFLDKLSTKDTIDVVAGRGIGMSAIKEEVDKYGGTILINNKTGKGVDFEFILPLKG